MNQALSELVLLTQGSNLPQGPNLTQGPMLTPSALPYAIQQQIHRETERLNIQTWKLHPWERRGKKGYLRLCGLNADGRDYLLARIPAQTLEEAEKLYFAVNNYLAQRPDWLGIDSSTTDKYDVVLTDDNLDWSKLL